MDGWFTVVCCTQGVEVVAGDLSGEEQLQEAHDGKPFWVAVAKGQGAAEQWAEAFLNYLTDHPARSSGHFRRLLELMAGPPGVPKIRIVPLSAFASVGGEAGCGGVLPLKAKI